MVITRSGGSSRKRLVKGSSDNKEGLVMDPIDVEPLRSAMVAFLVPYGTFEDEVLMADAFGPNENSLIESKIAKSSKLGDNPEQTLPETLVPDTKT